MRQRGEVIYNEQALLKKSVDVDDEGADEVLGKRPRSPGAAVPRQRRKSGEGGDEGAARRKRAPPRPPADDEADEEGGELGDGDGALPGGADNAIYLALTATGAALGNVVDEWLEAYERTPKEALLELLNFAVAAAGINLAVESDEPVRMDVPAVLLQLAEAAESQGAILGGTRYPLLRAREPEFRRLKAHAAEFIKQLVVEAHARELLLCGDADKEGAEDPSPIRWLLEALCAMASNAVDSRALRHTGTFLAFRLCDGLLIAHANASKACDEASAQLGARQAGSSAKKGAKTAAAASLGALQVDVQHAAEERDAIANLARALVDSVFGDRYRDKAADVRAEAASSLGGWLAKAPSLWLDNAHLKYFGWLLSDRDGGVRAAALDGIATACAAAERLPASSAFLGRFAPRLLETANDVHAPARLAAVKLLTALARLGAPPAGLEELEMGPLVNDEDASVRSAAVALLMQLKSQQGGGGADGGAPASGGKAAAAAARRAAGGGGGVRTRLRALAAELAALTSTNISGTVAGEDAPARAAHIGELFVDAAKAEKALLDVDELLALVADGAVDDKDADEPDAGGKRGSGKKKGGKGGGQASGGRDEFAAPSPAGPRAGRRGAEHGALQLALLAMLGATLDQAAQSGSKHARTEAAAEKAAANLEAAHAALALRLAAVVDASRDDAGALVVALGLVGKLPSATFADQGLRAKFGALLRALGAAFTSHTQHAPLAACARAWAAVCSGGHALQGDACAALAQLANRLANSAAELMPAAADAANGGARKRKAGGSATATEAGEAAQLLRLANETDFESAAVTLRRLAVLSVYLPLAPDRALWPLCLQLLEAQHGAFKALSAEEHVPIAREAEMAECALSLAHVLRAVLIRDARTSAGVSATLVDAEAEATPARVKSKGRRSSGRSAAADVMTPTASAAAAAAAESARGRLGADVRERRNELLRLLADLVTDGACAANPRAVELLEIATDVLIACADPADADSEMAERAVEPAVVGTLLAAAHTAFDEADSFAAARTAAAEAAADADAPSSSGGVRASTAWLAAELREKVVLLTGKLAHRAALPAADASAVALRALARPADESCNVFARQFWALAQLTLPLPAVREVEVAALGAALAHGDGDEALRLASALADNQRTIQPPAADAPEPDDEALTTADATVDVPAELLIHAASQPAHGGTPRGTPRSTPRVSGPAARKAAARTAWLASIVLRVAGDAYARGCAELPDDDEDERAALGAAEDLLELVGIPLAQKLPPAAREHVQARLERCKAELGELPPTDETARLRELDDVLAAVLGARGKSAPSPGRRSGGNARRHGDSDDEEDDEAVRPMPNSEPLPDDILDSDRPAPRRSRATASQPSQQPSRGRRPAAARKPLTPAQSEDEAEDEAEEEEPPRQSQGRSQRGAAAAAAAAAAAPQRTRRGSQPEPEAEEEEDEQAEEEGSEEEEKGSDEDEAKGSDEEEEEEEESQPQPQPRSRFAPKKRRYER
ncbi:hypothetical protein T492DRAFT_900101 [Pavlovales sp. CCMP2436]|nr:hypothetical protein T492DRAFT_900101 [Pavlovales sp. CCMP2436]